MRRTNTPFAALLQQLELQNASTHCFEKLGSDDRVEPWLVVFQHDVTADIPRQRLTQAIRHMMARLVPQSLPRLVDACARLPNISGTKRLI